VSRRRREAEAEADALVLDADLAALVPGYGPEGHEVLTMLQRARTRNRQAFRRPTSPPGEDHDDE
jgi:hypothetical protein